MIKKFRFTVSTRYLNSEVSEVVEVELDGDETEEEIQVIVNELHDEWVTENIDGGWCEVK